MLLQLITTFKCVLVASFLYVFLQVGVNSVSLNEEEEICVEQLNLNKTIIEAWNIEPLLPEDNEEVSEYLTCYWKRLGYQDENGELNYIKIGEVVHNDLKSRFHSDCLHIVAYVVDTCKNHVYGNSDGLKAIKMWNCLNEYTENLF